jgi:hypothetical protein
MQSLSQPVEVIVGQAQNFGETVDSLGRPSHHVRRGIHVPRGAILGDHSTTRVEDAASVRRQLNLAHEVLVRETVQIIPLDHLEPIQSKREPEERDREEQHQQAKARIELTQVFA